MLRIFQKIVLFASSSKGAKITLSLGLQFEVTEPAGIAADTISIFRNADFILMLATVCLPCLVEKLSGRRFPE
ncbi:MAG TPA: hypothetical protein GX525_05385 [Bacilli bacterium]|nr:hypothetical protein [Bacilli bacterium]